MKMEQSVPKRRHINFRRRGITQKKAHNLKDNILNLRYKTENHLVHVQCKDYIQGLISIPSE